MLFAATDVGVFYTANDGMKWRTLVNGLPRVTVLGLKLDASHRLWAATHGRSMWRIQEPSPCDVNMDGAVNVADVQTVVDQILGIFPATADINGDGQVNVVDLQIIVNAILGLGCNP